MTEDADIIVVGAGLAGLVAATEIADAGKRVIVVDQEGEQSLGGQAFWSFGGLFLVDSPEQRRLGIKDSFDLALQDWLGSAAFDRDKICGRGAGPRPMWRLRPARSAAGCARWAIASSPSSAGPSAAVTMR
jgi:glycine/D-amino acid oxidase-like deaminating enzyme